MSPLDIAESIAADAAAPSSDAVIGAAPAKIVDPSPIKVIIISRFNND